MFRRDIGHAGRVTELQQLVEFEVEAPVMVFREALGEQAHRHAVRVGCEGAVHDVVRDAPGPAPARVESPHPQPRGHRVALVREIHESERLQRKRGETGGKIDDIQLEPDPVFRTAVPVLHVRVDGRVEDELLAEKIDREERRLPARCAARGNVRHRPFERTRLERPEETDAIGRAAELRVGDPIRPGFGQPEHLGDRPHLRHDRVVRGEPERVDGVRRQLRIEGRIGQRRSDDAPFIPATRCCQYEQPRHQGTTSSRHCDPSCHR